MNKRQRLLTRARMTAPGRASNYEMADLRRNGNYRDTTWIVPWASLADPFHPNSKEEFLEHYRKLKEQDDTSTE